MLTYILHFFNPPCFGSMILKYQTLLTIQTFCGVPLNIWLLLFSSQFGFSQSLDFLVTFFLKAWHTPMQRKKRIPPVSYSPFFNAFLGFLFHNKLSTKRCPKISKVKCSRYLRTSKVPWMDLALALLTLCGVNQLLHHLSIPQLRFVVPPDETAQGKCNWYQRSLFLDPWAIIMSKYSISALQLWLTVHTCKPFLQTLSISLSLQDKVCLF